MRFCAKLLSNLANFYLFRKYIYKLYYNINYIHYLCIHINHSNEKMKKKLLYMPPAVAVVNNADLEKDESIFEMDKLEEDTGFLMLQVSNLWKNFHGRALKKSHGLTHVQYTVLSRIYGLTKHDTKQVTQTMLARHTRIDPMALSHVFRGLEAKGYIQRVTHPADVRAKAVSLSPKGKKLMEQVIHSIAEADNKFFEKLGKNADFFNKNLKKLLETNN